MLCCSFAVEIRHVPTQELGGSCPVVDSSPGNPSRKPPAVRFSRRLGLRSATCRRSCLRAADGRRTSRRPWNNCRPALDPAGIAVQPAPTAHVADCGPVTANAALWQLDGSLADGERLEFWSSLLCDDRVSAITAGVAGIEFPHHLPIHQRQPDHLADDVCKQRNDERAEITLARQIADVCARLNP